MFPIPREVLEPSQDIITLLSIAELEEKQVVLYLQPFKVDLSFPLEEPSQRSSHKESEGPKTTLTSFEGILWEEILP